MLTPQDLARACDDYLDPFGPDGGDDGGDFATWLEGWWRPVCPPVPDGHPAATSRGGGDGGQVRWFADGGEVFGYAESRLPGCYWVAKNAALPDGHAAAPRHADRDRPVPV